MADLLIELFSEEIPARMQARARDDLKALVTNGLVEAGLTYAGAAAFSTPRRLVLALEGVSPESRATVEDRKGPRTDAPAAAIDGFLRATGLTRDQLQIRDDKKALVFFAVVEKPGRPAAQIVAEVLDKTIRTFPWPKSMRWGSGSLRWVRPLQSILCILSDEAGADVVPLVVDGILAGNVTQGHRFLSKGSFAVSSYDDYAAKLKRAHVVLDPAERAAAILHDAQNMAFAAGLELVPDAALLTEVAGLVEWPVVLMGRIDEAFLSLPPEVLQTSMREHQKFFSVKNPRTGRIEGFVTVANTETADHGATILKGNQKVLSARLSDAKFFWEKDLRVAKAGMGEWLDGLMHVTFHNKLGSQYIRVYQISQLARKIAPLVGVAPEIAEQAANLAKADLRSAMVGEFPELQGLMGMYYAREAGLPESVALASRDHYAPLGPSDTVPTEPVSVAVALADKVNMLTGFWSVGEKPSGSKDPFALRRAALGVVRIVIENQTRISLRKLFIAAEAVRFGIGVRRGVTLTENIRQYGRELEDNPLRDLEWAREFYVQNERDECALRAIVEFLVDASRTWDIDSSYWNDLDENDRYVNRVLTRHDDFKTTKVDLVRVWNREIELRKIVYDDELRINIDETISLSPASFPNAAAFCERYSFDLLSFLHDRLKVSLRDEGIRPDIIDACLAMPGNDDLTLLVARARALAAFLKTDDGPNLLQGFKRANTLLTQAEQKDGVEYSYGADPKFAETDEERALFAALDHAEATITPAMKAEDFAAAMQSMATLRSPIDAFFTAVQVNADNSVTRRNRLNLLHRIRTICSGVADLTKIEG